MRSTIILLSLCGFHAIVAYDHNSVSIDLILSFNMFRLLNFCLVFLWMDITGCVRVKHSPSLTGVPKIRQTYFAWPANTPLSLKCKAHGEAPLHVRWYKDGKPIKSSANVFQDQKWNLKFRKPQLSDNGVYTCVVSNDYGSVKHNYSLRILQRIQSPPEIVSGYPKPVTVRVGDNVELECLEKPNGQVSDYRWLKTDSIFKTNQINQEKNNVSRISPLKYKSFEVVDDGTKLNGVKLELQHVTEKHMGYYTCFLSNSNGFSFGTAFLNVTPIRPTDPPEFLIPKDKRQRFIASMENDNVTFSCLVRGGAPLKYRWFYNGRLLESGKDHEIRESELVVRNVQRADNGIYTCKIKNGYGHIKHSFKLKVLALKPQLQPLLLPGYPKDRTAMIGDSTMLFCADTTDILVDYRWLKWDSSVKSFTQADLYNGTLFTMLHPKHHEVAPNKRGVYLKLTNLTKADEGLYTCMAMNMYMRYSYRSAFLTVKQPLQRNYDQQIPVAWLKRKDAQAAETTPKVEMTSKPIVTNHCFNDNENGKKDQLAEVKTQCETTAACGTIFNLRTNDQKKFCDEENLCNKHNVTFGLCAEITFERVLCCCIGELCNQPTIKLFQEAKKVEEHSSRTRLTPVIFFSTLVLTVSIMLALLAYRIRQRKAALKEGIVQKTRPDARKMTKQKIMETKWMKEDV